MLFVTLGGASHGSRLVVHDGDLLVGVEGVLVQVGRVVGVVEVVAERGRGAGGVLGAVGAVVEEGVLVAVGGGAKEGVHGAGDALLADDAGVAGGVLVAVGRVGSSVLIVQNLGKVRLI